MATGVTIHADFAAGVARTRPLGSRESPELSGAARPRVTP